jgi:hypothetical protein
LGFDLMICLLLGIQGLNFRILDRLPDTVFLVPQFV